MVISQIFAKIWRLINFVKMAAIHHLGFVVRIWTTHKEHQVVFIIVQNLVGIRSVKLMC